MSENTTGNWFSLLLRIWIIEWALIFCHDARILMNQHGRVVKTQSCCVPNIFLSGDPKIVSPINRHPIKCWISDWTLQLCFDWPRTCIKLHSVCWDSCQWLVLIKWIRNIHLCFFLLLNDSIRIALSWDKASFYLII